jgi:pimeloyl-ACP methyl ester carboxylesterase
MNEADRTRASAVRTLAAGWGASVPVAALATVAVLALPRRRGIDFPMELRWAVLTPLCIGAAVAAAFAYRALLDRGAPRPRAVLAGGVLAAGLVVAAVAGRVSVPTVVVTAAVAAAIALLVPRALERPRRGRVRTALLVLFGALELVAVVGAAASELPSAERVQAIPREVFDAEHRYLELANGARIHYVDEGTGPTLLFLHGNPSWSFQWRDLIGALRNDYRCVALDYPGFGWSDAPPGFGFTAREESLVVEAFVDRLALRDVTLVMQDWGGPIGLGFAERRPELVRALILGSTWAWPTDTSSPRGKFSVIAGGPVGELVQVNFNGFAKGGIGNGIVHAPAPGILDAYVRPFRPLDRRGIAAFYPGQINDAKEYFEEVEAGLPRVAAKPALIFWALRDRGFPSADRERFEATFRDHRTIELPEADHFFFEDSLGEMLPAIRSFVPR